MALHQAEGYGIWQSRSEKSTLRVAGEQLATVKLDKESVADMDNVVEMREVMVRTGNNRCPLVIDMTINNCYF